MMETLTLSNGTVIAGHMLEVDERLYLYMTEITLAAAFALLNEPANTAEIREDRYGQETTVRGYTALWAISRENGQICATMRKNN